MTWPDTIKDTVLYSKKEYIADQDQTVRMIDNAKAEFIGNIKVYGNITASGDIISNGDVRNFDAVGDGIKDDTLAIQAALDAVASGGLVTSAPDKVYKVTSTLIVKRTALSDKVRINLNGSIIQWAGGSSPVFQFNGGGSHPIQRGPVVENLEVDGGGTASLGFHWTDAGRSLFRDIIVANVVGFAFNLRNYTAFSENMTFERIFVLTCGGIAKYDGASDTGGTGQSSFARQNWNNITGALGGVWFENSPGAFPYGSSFNHIKGNCSAIANTVIFNLKGAMGGGTRIRNLDVEQAGANSFLFNFNGVVSGLNPTLDSYSLRDGMGLVTGGDIGSFGITTPIGQSFRLDEDQSLIFFPSPATVGCIRVPNNRKISARNAGGTANADLIYLDGNDRVVVGGGTGTAKTWIPTAELELDGIINHDGTQVGFYNVVPVNRPTSVTARAALEATGLGLTLTPELKPVVPLATVTSTATLGQAGSYIRFTGASPSYTLPANSVVAFPISTEISGTCTTGTMTVVQGAGAVVNKARTLVTTAAFSGWTAIKVNTDEWDIHGDFV